MDMDFNNNGKVEMGEAMYAMGMFEDAERNGEWEDRDYHSSNARRTAAKSKGAGCMTCMVCTFAVWMLFTMVVAAVV